MKKLFKSKTINFAAILGGFGAAQTTMEGVQAFVDPALYGWITMIVAVVVGALRKVTTQPLSEK